MDYQKHYNCFAKESRQSSLQHKRPERVADKDADNVKKQKEQTRQKVKTWRNRQKTENSAKYVPLKKTDKEEKNES